MKKGVTFIELIISMVIISILTSAAIPVARTSVIRSREHELKRNLMSIRGALDRFRDDFLDSQEGEGDPEDEEEEERDKIGGEGGEGKGDRFFQIREEVKNGYPPDLETLVEYRYLRRIPGDPFSQERSEDRNSNWGIISFDGKGGDVYDIYSKSSQISLGGKAYSSW